MASAPTEEFSDLRRDIDDAFMRTLDLAPDFAERIRAATRMSKARNQMIDPASFFNRENLARLLGQSSAAV